MLKHFFLLKCLTLFSILGMAQTCDLELTGYTPPPSGSGLHTFTVSFTNAENCGCNEFTQSDGNNCDESGSTHVQNNETVSHIVFGLHYVNEETGEDYGENTDCTSTSFHPGWSYVLSTAVPPGGFNTGSFSTFAVNPPFSWDCILENPIEGYCWEVVIWQINLSQTADTEDFPEDGWSTGNSFNNTQVYPDIDISNNSISWCPDPVVTDTVYVYQTDTIFLTDTLYVDNYIYDTTYVEVTDTILVDNYIYEYITDTILVDNYIYETDTLFLTEYVTDTVFITTVDTLIQYEYIVITDTVTEYIVQEIYIDCDTGLPCDDAPGFDCPDWTSIYIPNTFTPNNDGFNDVWKIILDLNCWYDVEFQIYNRWGDKIYHGYGDSFDSYPYWDGSIDDGDHYAADGVYTYIVRANKLGSAEVFRKSGHLTIFR